MKTTLNKYAVAYDPVALEIRGRLDGQGELCPGEGTQLAEFGTQEELEAFIAENGLQEGLQIR